MDFGFGAFLEKFEGYFGKRLTKLLIGLMAMTVVVVCAGLLYKGAVAPLIGFVAGYSKYDATIVRFVRIAWAIAAVGLGLQVGIGLSQSIRNFFAGRMLLKTAKLIVSVESTSRGSRKLSREIRSLHEEAKANLAETIKLREAAIETVRAVINKAKQDVTPVGLAQLNEYVALLEQLHRETERYGDRYGG